ncbi:MAG TPA: flagellin, partial [Opitutus sp.]|nr:flagellin [Opitutus sp.]
MSVVINTNYAATLASNNLAASNANLQKSLNRLSSGSKIVNPSDDAGGLAVSMKLSAAARRQGAVASNIGNAVSLLQTQDGALKVAAKVLERISELKVLHSDVTKSTSDKANYDSEFTALKTQLTDIAGEKFNGVALFGSSAVGNVNVTEDGATSVSIAARDLSSTGSGVGQITSTAATSLGSVQLAEVTTAIQNVA